MKEREQITIGACTITRRNDWFQIKCPRGMAQVFRDRVYLYGPWERTARAYFDRYVYEGVTGRVRAVQPVTASMRESFEDIGLIVGAEEPHELYEAIEERMAEPRRRFWIL